jgi:hypothetical protein
MYGWGEMRSKFRPERVKMIRNIQEEAAKRGRTSVTVLRDLQAGRVAGRRINRKGWAIGTDSELCRYCSVAEAADIMGVSATYVHRRLNNGTLDGKKLSQKAWLVLRDAAHKDALEYKRKLEEAARDGQPVGRPRSRWAG